jgi:hypothetical protein
MTPERVSELWINTDSDDPHTIGEFCAKVSAESLRELKAEREKAVESVKEFEDQRDWYVAAIEKLQAECVANLKDHPFFPRLSVLLERIWQGGCYCDWCIENPNPTLTDALLEEFEKRHPVSPEEATKIKEAVGRIASRLRSLAPPSGGGKS